MPGPPPGKGSPPGEPSQTRHAGGIFQAGSRRHRWTPSPWHWRLSGGAACWAEIPGRVSRLQPDLLFPDSLGGNVSQGQDAHRPAGRIRDEHPPDLLFLHDPGGVLQAGVLRAGEHVAAHDVFYPGAGRVTPLSHAPEHDVPVGHDPHHATSARNGHGPDIEVSHLERGIHERCIHGKHFRIGRHDLPDPHDLSPCMVLFFPRPRQSRRGPDLSRHALEK